MYGIAGMRVTFSSWFWEILKGFMNFPSFLEVNFETYRSSSMVEKLRLCIFMLLRLAAKLD